MLVGHMRASKADGSQIADLQRDALLAADVDNECCMRTWLRGRRMTLGMSTIGGPGGTAISGTT